MPEYDYDPDLGFTYDSSELARLQAIYNVTDNNQTYFIGNFYSPKDEDYYADKDVSDPDAPARFTDIPTSSLNASRPRTVAAGYDTRRSVLTVMFRDGTVYNYYDISPDEWINFHSSISKGRPWLNRGGPFVLKEHGPADLSNVDPAIFAEIHRLARVAQVRYQYRGSVPKSARTKAQYAPRSATSRQVMGKNTAKGGVNPNRNNGKSKPNR